MSDAKINDTVFVDNQMMPGVGHENYGGVGVVIYSNTFNVNGVQVWIVPGTINLED